MKNTIRNLVVVAALSSSGSAALAAGETESTAQPAAAQPVSAVAPATAAESTPPAPEPQPATQRPFVGQSGSARPKDLDLRHCLELDDNAAIARCAGE